MNINDNITLYNDIYLKDIKKEDRGIYLLYTNLNSSTVSQDIIYNIMNYKDIYDDLLNNYRDDLFNKLWKKYEDDNIVVYIVKEVSLEKSEVFNNEVANMFIDIIVTSYYKNIKNLYTYYNFDKYLNKSLFELYLNKLSEEGMKLYISTKKQ